MQEVKLLLREQIARLKQALEVIETGDPDPQVVRRASAPKRARKQMSKAARKRISEMMKKRWAERRKAGK